MYYIIPLIFCVLAEAFDFIFFKKSNRKKHMLAITLILACFVDYAFIIFHYIISHYFMAGNNDAFPLASSIFLSLSLNTLCIMYFASREKKAKKVLRSCLIAIAAVFLVEIFFFNAKSITTDYKTAYIDHTQFKFVLDDKNNAAGYNSSKYAVVTNQCGISVSNIPEWTKGFSVQCKQDKNQRPIIVSALMKDNNFRNEFQLAGKKVTSTYGEDVKFSLYPYKQARAIEVKFNYVNIQAKVYGITVYNKLPYEFSSIRFIGILLIIFCISAIRSTKFASVTFDIKKNSHFWTIGILIAAWTLVSCLSMVSSRANQWAPTEYRTPIKYNSEAVDEMHVADNYGQLFDAIKKGQVYLDIKPDESLTDLNENDVYDKTYRENAKADYLFDHVYYNGKYYSYFGIVPVFTFYFPYEALTGYVPSMYQANIFFSLQSMFFFCLMLIEIILTYCKRPNFLLTILLIPATSVLCGAIYCLQYPNVYDIAVSSGTGYAFMSVFFGLLACRCKGMKKRGVLFFLSGLAFIMAIGSRPTAALMALILAPTYLHLLLGKQYNLKQKIMQAGLFLIPIFIGAIGLCYYNYLRFGSPFEFGAKWQLTISNMDSYKFRLTGIFSSIYHYFLTMPESRDYFPFFTYGVWSDGNYLMFNNVEQNIGVLMYPIIFLTFILLYRGVKNHEYNINLGTVTIVENRGYIIVSFVLAFFLAWMDFCYAGVSIRYTFDFIPLLLLVASVLILQNCTLTGFRYHLAVFSIVATFILQFFLQFDGHIMGNCYSSLILAHPQIEEILERTLIFWQ